MPCERLLPDCLCTTITTSNGQIFVNFCPFIAHLLQNWNMKGDIASEGSLVLRN